jgi:hypothetical protein
MMNGDITINILHYSWQAHLTVYMCRALVQSLYSTIYCIWAIPWKCQPEGIIFLMILK